jgi:hypothetical protein
MSTIKIRTGQLRQLVKEAMTRDDLAIGGFDPEPLDDGAGQWIEDVFEEIRTYQDDYTDEEILAKLDQFEPHIIEAYLEEGVDDDRLSALMNQAMGRPTPGNAGRPGQTKMI